MCGPYIRSGLSCSPKTKAFVRLVTEHLVRLERGDAAESEPQPRRRAS
jgi:hypothetical protein